MLYGMLLIDKTTCKALVPLALINMNNVINKFLLAGDKCMPEMQLRHFNLFIVLVVLLLDIKKELKNFNKQVIRVIFIEMNLIKLVFNTILLMLIIKI